MINGDSTPDVTIPIINNEADNRVTTILVITGLNYLEFLHLLESYFINPKNADARTIKITAKESETVLTCNLEKLVVTGADNLWLRKMLRFIRLSKKTGWDILDIDRTLTAFGLTDFPGTAALFNEKLLIPFFRVETIRQKVNQPIREVLSFFTNIDINNSYINQIKVSQPRVTSLYDTVFRDKPLAELENSPFKVNAEGFTGTISDHKKAIGDALFISESDLDLMIDENENLS